MPRHSFGAYQFGYNQSASAQALDDLAEKRIRVPGHRRQNERRINDNIPDLKHGSIISAPATDEEKRRGGGTVARRHVFR